MGTKDGARAGSVVGARTKKSILEGCGSAISELELYEEACMPPILVLVVECQPARRKGGADRGDQRRIGRFPGGACARNHPSAGFKGRDLFPGRRLTAPSQSERTGQRSRTRSGSSRFLLESANESGGDVVLHAHAQ